MSQPPPLLMEEAKENLAGLSQVVFCGDINEITNYSVELIFCLEVFEHLPEKETKDALGQFNRLLCDNGSAIIGVPVEIGIPALYKGIFRMSRRFNAFDASIKNVLLASMLHPPKDRPVAEIAPGFAFHYEHMGFDYRQLKSLLRSHFKLQQVATSPFSIFGTWLNPEVNFLVSKINTD